MPPEESTAPDLENDVTTDPSTEDEIKFARLQGWTDKDEYNGEPETWKTAHEFLEYGRSHNRVLKQNNDKLLSQVSELQQTMQQLVADTEQQKKKAVDKAISDLKQQKAEAITEADGERVNQIDEEIDRLKTEQISEPAVNPHFKAWVKDNQWYENDPELAIEADALANMYINANHNLQPEKVYELITNRIKRDFPEKFHNPNKNEPASVAKGHHTKPTPGKKTYNDLPPEAKQACDRFCKNIPGFTKEKYLETYEWD